MIFAWALAGSGLICLAVSAWWWRQAQRKLRRRSPASDSDPPLVAVDGDAERATLLTTSIDAMHFAVVLLDDRGRVVFRNREAERFVDPRHGNALVAAVVAEVGRAALGSRAVPGREVELIGPPYSVQRVRAYPLSKVGHGSPGGAVVLVDDVTEGRLLDAVRRDFIANISHELRTPLGAIRLLAETIVDEKDPATVSRLAQRMTTEADRVALTIDDLTELSRIEFADDMVRERLELHAVIGDAQARIAAAAEQKAITVECPTASASPIVSGDRRQLTSAVSNLLDNAVKYSTAGSTVRVSTQLDGADATVSVTDTGMGIPSKDIDRVFERFFRVDRARSRGTGGTGLGLAIVRHVAANHGGGVSVSSREGFGSTFVLRLPCVGSTPPVHDGGVDPPEAQDRVVPL